MIRRIAIVQELGVDNQRRWQVATSTLLTSQMWQDVKLEWFDGFFLSMLATSVIVVLVNWQRYYLCTYPLHIWIVVDYATVFVFRILMFVDNGLAAGMGQEATPLERMLRFKGRVFVLSLLTFLFYPFLWAWTVIGSMWFTNTRGCLPEEGQKWGFLIWLVFSYCALICIACISTGKWLLRRQSHLALISNGQASISEFQVFLELIRIPDWTLRPRSMHGPTVVRNGDSATSFPPGLFVNNIQAIQAAQREKIERAIQQLPKFCLTSVSENCNQCPICLDEFEIGTEVRGLPCAHNFHIDCIDSWLRLNVKCPHCRRSVFPDLDPHIPQFPSAYQQQHVPRSTHSHTHSEASNTNNEAIAVTVPNTIVTVEHEHGAIGASSDEQVPSTAGVDTEVTGTTSTQREQDQNAISVAVDMTNDRQ